MLSRLFSRPSTTAYYTPNLTPNPTNTVESETPVDLPEEPHVAEEPATQGSLVSEHVEDTPEPAPATAAPVEEPAAPTTPTLAVEHHDEPVVDEVMDMKMPVPEIYPNDKKQHRLEDDQVGGVSISALTDDVTDIRPAWQTTSPTYATSVGHGTFAEGAGTVVGPPRDQPDENLHQRAATAEMVLSAEERVKLEKTEGEYM